MLQDANTIEAVLDYDRIYIIPEGANIKVFDITGRYLFDLGSQGQGPSEYRKAKLLPDTQRQIIWILDPWQHKLMKYKKDGSFLGATQVGKYVSQICFYNSELVGLNLPIKNIGEKTELIFYNLEGKVVRTVPIYNEIEEGMGSNFLNQPLFGQINGKFHFAELPFGKVFLLNGSQEWVPEWEIVLTNNKPKKESPIEPLDNTQISKIVESKNFFFLTGMKNRRFQHFYVEKSTGLAQASRVSMETENDPQDVSGLINDIDGGFPFWPVQKGYKNQYLSIFNAIKLIDLADGKVVYHYGKQTNPVSNEIKELANHLTPDSNPVIMLVTINE
jgi:hypothetical protein